MVSETLFAYLRRWLFGKPDGVFHALRCRLFGHRWKVCDDVCCDGEIAWCRRCLVPKEPT